MVLGRLEIHLEQIHGFSGKDFHERFKFINQTNSQGTCYYTISQTFVSLDFAQEAMMKNDPI